MTFKLANGSFERLGRVTWRSYKYLERCTLLKKFMWSIYMWSPFFLHTMMDHDNYTYLAITLSNHSRYFDNPSSITSIHPSLGYCGRVGQFSDVHLISIPKDVWLRDGSALMSQLIGSDGVLHVDVQVLRTRSKRYVEELWSIWMTTPPLTISNVNSCVSIHEQCVIIFISDSDLVLGACHCSLGNDILYYKLWGKLRTSDQFGSWSMSSVVSIVYSNMDVVHDTLTTFWYYKLLCLTLTNYHCFSVHVMYDLRASGLRTSERKVKNCQKYCVLRSKGERPSIEHLL